MFILKRKHSIVYIGIKARYMVIRSYYANIIALYISQRMVALKLVGTSCHFFDIRFRTASISLVPPEGSDGAQSVKIGSLREFIQYQVPSESLSVKPIHMYSLLLITGKYQSSYFILLETLHDICTNQEMTIFR